MSDANCPSRERLLAFHVGALPEGDAAALIEHISTCQTCQTVLETFDASSDSLVEQLRHPLPADPYPDEVPCQEVLGRIKMSAGRTGDVSGPAEAASLSELGEYRLLEKLGQGGMGTVYKAWHTELGREVAVKVLPKERAADEQADARFRREIKAVGGLDHPNIVRAMDAREIEGTRFLVMEYVEGASLSELVRRCGVLQVPDACELIRQAALGLQHAHQHGMVHRDVKPSNLMLSSSGQVKILDLGLALLRRAPPGGEESTGSGQAMGTAEYMAPEQVSDSHTVDIRADIYGLGCTLYKLLAGHAPFTGPEYPSAFDKMMAHVRDPVPPVWETRPDIPEDLAAIIDRMLAKDPAERFATPQEVVDALGPLCAGCNLPALAKKAEQHGESPLTAGKPPTAADKGASSALVDTGRQAEPPSALCRQRGSAGGRPTRSHPIGAKAPTPECPIPQNSYPPVLGGGLTAPEARGLQVPRWAWVCGAVLVMMGLLTLFAWLFVGKTGTPAAQATAPAGPSEEPGESETSATTKPVEPSIEEGKAVEGQKTKPKKDSQNEAKLKEIALVMQWVHLPEFAQEQVPESEVVRRLDAATEEDPRVEVGATLLGAKLAGWAAGYEFTPGSCLNAGETPREAVSRLSGESDLVLLLRVSARPPLRGTPLIPVFADAALYRRTGLKPLLNAGFISLAETDRTALTDQNVDAEYLMKTIAAAFARDFDAKVLSKMQEVVEGERIAEAVSRVRVHRCTLLVPSITSLEGGDEREAELAVGTKRVGVRGVVYLDPMGRGNPRKWLLGGAQEVHTHLDPGEYTIYVEVPSANEGSQPQVYRSDVRIEYKRRYSYTIP